jgi:hypothetical protein
MVAKSSVSNSPPGTVFVSRRCATKPSSLSNGHQLLKLRFDLAEFQVCNGRAQPV